MQFLHGQSACHCTAKRHNQQNLTRSQLMAKKPHSFQWEKDFLCQCRTALRCIH